MLALYSTEPNVNDSYILNGTKFELQSNEVTSVDSYGVINWSLLVPCSLCCSFQLSVIYKYVQLTNNKQYTCNNNFVWAKDILYIVKRICERDCPVATHKLF